MMTTATMERKELNNAELEMVNGSTFTPNTLKDNRYSEVGIRFKFHLFQKDEFWLPNGTKTDMNGADAFVKSVVGEQKYEEWYNENHPIPAEGGYWDDDL